MMTYNDSKLYWRAAILVMMCILPSAFVLAADDAPTSLPAEPSAYFFKGKLISVAPYYLVPIKADARVAVMAEFHIDRKYGEVHVAMLPGDASGLANMRLRALADIALSDVRRSGPDAFPEIMTKLGITLGKTYLVKVESGPGPMASDEFATLTPYSPETENTFISENQKLIDYTVTYIKAINRITRRQSIEAFSSRIAHMQGMLASNSFPAEERAEMEKQIAESQQKLKDLLATPEDVYPPPNWTE